MVNKALLDLTDADPIAEGDVLYIVRGGNSRRATLGQLAAIDSLSFADGNIIVGNGSTWVAESGNTARTSLGVGTGDSPQFAGVNVGHASDTTITRTGAGDIAVEGNAVYRASGTDVPVADGGTGASTASGARTNLGLGTAAVQNTGTSGSNVPLLNTACTWVEGQVFSTSSSFGTPATFSSTNADANAGPQFLIDRNSASPANSDNIGSLAFGGRDSNGNFVNYAGLGAQILDVTDGSEDGRVNIDAQIAGSQTTIVSFGPRPYMVNATTTASAANAFLNSGSSPANELLRSTSSLRYKREVEGLDASYADALLSLRPVWYRSACEADRPDWSWYGLIAEEVANVDPRLVHYGYADDAYETIETECFVETKNEKGEKVRLPYKRQERRLKEGAELVPDGVQYERLTVLLLDVIKRQDARIAALEARAQ